MPDTAHVHQASPVLTKIAVEYPRDKFIAETLFPVVKVVKEADQYYKFLREELHQTEDKRAAGAEAKEVEWSTDTGTYNCEEHALKQILPTRVIDNADVAIRPKAVTTEKLVRRLLRNQEIRVKALVDTVTSGLTPTIKWDAANPIIEDDIDTVKDALKNACGFEANILVLSRAVKKVVKKDPTLRALWKYVTPSPDATFSVEKLFAAMFDIDNVVTGEAVYNAANPKKTANILPIWGDNVLVAYIDKNPGIGTITLGVRFRTQDFKTSTWYNEDRKGDFIEVGYIQDEVLIAGDCGRLISDVLT